MSTPSLNEMLRRFGVTLRPTPPPAPPEAPCPPTAPEPTPQDAPSEPGDVTEEKQEQPPAQTVNLEVVSHPQRKTGRPSRFNEKLADALLQCLRAGLSRNVACKRVGIGGATFAAWMERHVEFSQAVEQAQAEAVERHLNTINLAASEGDWRASAFYLERCIPAEFARIPGSLQGGGHRVVLVRPGTQVEDDGSGRPVTIIEMPPNGRDDAPPLPD